MRLWRLTALRHADTALSGVGNRRFGSRWVSPGHAAVYASATLSLAVLEMLVHMEPRHFRQRYVALPIDLPRGCSVESVDVAALPPKWPTLFESSVLRRIGDEWVRRGESPVLQVPSAVIPMESNYILNPEHPAFPQIRVGEPVPFGFDSRLYPD